MKLLGSEQHKLIFGWTEKCNCTGVVKMFFNEINLLDEALEYNPWIHKYRKKYMDNNNFDMNTLKYKNYLKIKFVRCPYDRAVSSYLHVCKTKNLPPEYTFEMFLRSLIDNNKQLNPNVKSHSGHQKCLGENIKDWNEIVKCENIHDEILRINKIYGRNFKSNFSSEHWNTNRLINEYTYVGNIPYTSELHKHNYINFYNNISRELVERYYRIDIYTFSYNYEDFILRNTN